MYVAVFLFLQVVCCVCLGMDIFFSFYLLCEFSFLSSVTWYFVSCFVCINSLSIGIMLCSSFAFFLLKFINCGFSGLMLIFQFVKYVVISVTYCYLLFMYFPMFCNWPLLPCRRQRVHGQYCWFLVFRLRIVRRMLYFVLHLVFLYLCRICMLQSTRWIISLLTMIA